MDFRVRFVGADHPAVACMPAGRPWVICVTDVATTLYLATDAQGLTVEEKQRHLESAWAGYRAISDKRRLEVGELI